VTQQELQALVELLNRCPMTGAERIWVQELIGRLAAAIDEEKPEGEENTIGEEL